MGFRKDAYATVWSVESLSNVVTKGRISISRKNRQTGEYEQDFSGFVLFIGTAAAKKATFLKERDRIKLGDVDVSTHYDKEKNVTYTTYKIFSFEKDGDDDDVEDEVEANDEVGNGEVDDSLPF